MDLVNKLVCFSKLTAMLSIALFGMAQSAPAEEASLTEVMADDATLNAVTFVDARHGWAVGDRGLILHTDDGGLRWHLQVSTTDASLRDVTFIDAEHGWAVGGLTRPYTHRTRGVVLQTDNGGQTWQRTATPTLPALRQVKFFDRNRGIAAGAGSSFAPSGIFRTEDGGRLWHSLSTDRLCHWTAASLSAGTSLFGDAAGRLATGLSEVTFVRNTKPNPGHPPQPASAAIRGLTVNRHGTAYAVGDLGFVQQSHDEGQTWQAADMPALAKHYDWHAVSAVGNQVWSVGSPGTRLLHSEDGGTTWTLRSTPVATPLLDIHFADIQRGWAVGALGTILSTRDSGRSWQVQRRGATRSAALVVCNSTEAAPLELLGKLAATDGYITSVIQLGADTPADAQRLTQAATSLGASYTSVITSPTSEQLVRVLRTMRPNLVVVASEPSRGFTESVEQACLNAADPTFASDDLRIDLAPWSVSRIVQTEPDNSAVAGMPRVSTTDFQPALGTSLSQWIAPARGITSRHYRKTPERVNWSLVAGMPIVGTRNDNPMAGIALPAGSDARRRRSQASTGKLSALRTLAQKGRHMERLQAGNLQGAAWASEVVSLTGGLDANSGAHLLFDLGQYYLAANKHDLAADTFYLMARRYTGHPLKEPAMQWLIHYYASSEAGLAVTQTAGQGVLQQSLANVRSDRPAQIDLTRSKTAVPSLRERSQRAIQLAQYIEQTDAAWFSDPAVRFSLAAAIRAGGDHERAATYVVGLANQAIAEPWRDAAAVERWLAESRRTSSAKPTLESHPVSQRPLLDGKLDEAIWQQAQTLKLTGSKTDLGADHVATQVRVANDRQFLFVSIECQKRPGHDYFVDQGPRPRDGASPEHDQLTMTIDVDRDYTTALKLSVDSRGWTADTCWPHDIGRPSMWNPDWYVATQHDATHWRSEIAIPLAELAPRNAVHRKAWAMGVTRHTTDSDASQPIESWTGITNNSPADYGVLLLARRGNVDGDEADTEKQ